MEPNAIYENCKGEQVVLIWVWENKGLCHFTSIDGSHPRTVSTDGFKQFYPTKIGSL